MSGSEHDAPEVPVRPVRTPETTALHHVRRALLPRRRHLLGVSWLILDRSTSMGDPGKMEALREGAWRYFVQAVRRSHAVGAVAFGDDARILCGAGIDAHRFRERLAGLRPFGRTRMEAGLRLTAARLRARRGTRTALLLTDGVPDDPEAALREAATLRALGVRLVAVGTGDADAAFLRALAGGAPGLVRTVPRQRLVGALEQAGAALGPAPLPSVPRSGRGTR